jgi:hypothetical protein
METKPIIHATIASILALGEAVGGHTLHRAGQQLRSLLAEGVMSPEASDILETVLVGIDHDAPEIQIERPEYRWWEDINALAATAH